MEDEQAETDLADLGRLPIRMRVAQHISYSLKNYNKEKIKKQELLASWII